MSVKFTKTILQYNGTIVPKKKPKTVVLKQFMSKTPFANQKKSYYSHFNCYEKIPKIISLTIWVYNG